MSPTWSQRKARLQALLESTGDEEIEGLSLDRLLHGQTVTGKTPKTVEVDDIRFSDKDLDVVGALAHGQFGTVDLVNCRLDGRVYVRKRLEKKTALKARDQCSPQIERDILLLALKSKTTWVPHMLCAFQSAVHLSIVMPYAEGGSLWDVLESSPDNGRICLEDLQWWMPQCVSAINWCHSQGFVHRDIKPHNFVLGPDARILLIDFGSAAPLLPSDPDGVQLVPKQYCLVPCGTCDYISPEILKAHEEALVALEMSDENEGGASSSHRRTEDEEKDAGGYGRETDWWSLGVMIYEMAYGVAPFFAKDIGQTYLKIMEHERSLKFDTNSVPSDLIQLLRGLLSDYEHRLGRYSTKDIMRQPFFKQVHWESLHTLSAPEGLHLPQFTYATPHNSIIKQREQSMASDQSISRPFAFSALFNSSSGSSPGLSVLHATPARGGISASDQQAINSFIGFSWGPTHNAFTDSVADDDIVAHNANGHPHLFRFPPQPQFNDDLPDGAHASTNFVTPMRPRALSMQHTLARTGTIRRTAERRVVSDREAMKQLVDCIGMSARKRVLESGRKPRVLSSALSGRRRTSMQTVKKELRFDQTSVPDLVVDTASTSASSSDTEEQLSPSPSPRPGSAMSISRRSGTPTMSMSGTLPYTRDMSRSLSLGGGGPKTDLEVRGGQALLGDALFDDMERRYARLVQGIASVKKQFDSISLQIQDAEHRV